MLPHKGVLSEVDIGDGSGFAPDDVEQMVIEQCWLVKLVICSRS